MKSEKLKLELYGIAHNVSMGYLDDNLFSKINANMSFQELESLIGKWDELGSIFQGVMLNPDYAFFIQNESDTPFYFNKLQNWINVCHQDNDGADEESLKRIEEFTQIKSSKEQLTQSLRNVPYYPQKPNSRYIIVFIKSEDAFMGSCAINGASKYDADKVVFAQSNFQDTEQTTSQIITDIVLNIRDHRFNFLAGLLYDGETIEIDSSEYECEPFAFDMWIFDTETKETVYTGDFMRDSSFTDRLGIANQTPLGFVDKIYERQSKVI